MSKSKGVVVVGVRVRRTGALVRLLCQIAAVRARIRWVMRELTPVGVRAPWRSRSSCPLRVSLTDSMI